ncbi:hypothetical protein TWF506_003990 [Arthrobotrys conoides]|uniref:F-box domain-containing protein n=1 Tax=Arthrobotrys conoides TaxID=74498 RepID=A0AAN8N3H4_9PEZI
MTSFIFGSDASMDGLEFSHICRVPVNHIELRNARTGHLVLYAGMQRSGQITNYYHSPLSADSIQRVRAKYLPIEPAHMSYRVPVVINALGEPLKLAPTPSTGQKQETRLAKISRELFDEITSYLGASDLVALSQTCVDFFHTIAYDQKIWYNRFLDVNKPKAGEVAFKLDLAFSLIFRTLIWVCGRKQWFYPEDGAANDHELIFCWVKEFDNKRFYYRYVVDILQLKDWWLEADSCHYCLTQKGVHRIFDGTKAVSRACQTCILERFGYDHIAPFHLCIHHTEYTRLDWEDNLVAWLQHGYLKPGMVLQHILGNDDVKYLIERGYIIGCSPGEFRCNRPPAFFPERSLPDQIETNPCDLLIVPLLPADYNCYQPQAPLGIEASPGNVLVVPPPVDYDCYQPLTPLDLQLHRQRMRQIRDQAANW